MQCPPLAQVLTKVESLSEYLFQNKLMILLTVVFLKMASRSNKTSGDIFEGEINCIHKKTTTQAGVRSLHAT